MDLSEIKTNPVWNERNEKEIFLKQQNKFLNKTPIECLETNELEVLYYDNGELIVGIDRSYDYNEGIESPRFVEIPNDNLYLIPKELITDYNSLWELTQTGWDSGNPRLYPYIFVKEKNDEKFRIWRWDNYFIRVNCLTHKWDESNFEKFYKTEEFRFMVSNKPPKIKSGFIELGRNEKCWCGSGKKYKNCCKKSQNPNYHYDNDIIIQ
jgi:hypothetical protein